MIAEADVQAKLAALRQGELSLSAFENWIEDASWGMHRDSAPAVVKLVSMIHRLMSERDYGLYDESEFRRQLAALVKAMPVLVRAEFTLDGDRPRPAAPSPYDISSSGSVQRESLELVLA